MISATPFAKTTTRETEKPEVLPTDTAETSLCEIVIDEAMGVAEQALRMSVPTKTTTSFARMGSVCQIFARHIAASCRIYTAILRHRVHRMRKFAFTLICALLLMNPAAAQAVTGAQGQAMTASATTVKSGSTVIVTGSHFDETVGIYLGFCVVPKKGLAPTPCGGGINKAGIGDASFWISSNPPPYGIGLAQEFLPGGRFTQKLKITKLIGKFDCTKVKCAITVRADHLRTGDRSYDLFIPITIKK